jgi:methionyl-tRNA formyltransferase
MTGVTIMQMEEGLDTGPLLAAMGTPVDRKTAGELTEELARLGAEWMVETLARLGRIGPRPQDEAKATYAAKIGKEEARFDFTHPAAEVERQVRAFNPRPGAWFEHDGERIKILAADPVEAEGEPGTVIDDRLTIACGGGALAPRLVQRAGRAAMGPAELLRGFPLPPGTKLG